MTVTNAIYMLLAFIVVLSVWAYIDRDRPMDKPNQELDEARRFEAEDDDDV